MRPLATLAIALVAAASACAVAPPRANGASPPQALAGDSDSDVAVADAFVRDVVAGVASVDAIDVTAHLLSGGCLDPPGNDQAPFLAAWCPSMHSADEILASPERRRAEAAHVIAIGVDALKPPCTRVDARDLALSRDDEIARSLPGALDSAGHTSESPDEIARYQAYLRSIEVERVIAYQCADAPHTLKLVRYRGHNEFHVAGLVSVGP